MIHIYVLLFQRSVRRPPSPEAKPQKVHAWNNLHGRCIALIVYDSVSLTQSANVHHSSKPPSKQYRLEVRSTHWAGPSVIAHLGPDSTPDRSE